MSAIIDWLFVSQLAIGIILCTLLLSLLMVGGYFYVLLGGLLSWGLYESLGVHSSPEKVTLAFIQATSRLDSAAMSKLVTPETNQLIASIWGFVGQLGEAEHQRIQDEAAQIKQATCQLSADGNAAQCTVCCQTDGNPIPQAIPTQRIGGRWFVHITKESINNGNNTDSQRSTEPMRPENAQDTIATENLD